VKNDAPIVGPISLAPTFAIYFATRLVFPTPNFMIGLVVKDKLINHHKGEKLFFSNVISIGIRKFIGGKSLFFIK
jgi:hypothetical protein